MCADACVCAHVWLFACYPLCQYLSMQCTRYRRICITMNLNSRVRHCVLTLIYSLYKWVNKYTVEKNRGSWRKHIIIPRMRRLREEQGLKCNLGWLVKAHIQRTELDLSLLCFNDISKSRNLKKKMKTMNACLQEKQNKGLKNKNFFSSLETI